MTAAASEQVPAVVVAAFLQVAVARLAAAAAVVVAAFLQVAVARLAAAAAVVVAAERPMCTPAASPD